MSLLRKMLRALGHVSALDWAYRLAPVVFGIAMAVWALVQGWPTVAIALAGLLSFTALMVLVTLGHYWLARYKEQQLPERHRAILIELATRLAELKTSALTVGAWERNSPTPHQMRHSERHKEVVERLAQLIDQVSYDEPTASTCKDFAQLCHFIVYDAIHKQDYSESRQELDRMSVGLFRQLHAGRSIDRSKVELPNWIRQQDEEARQQGRERNRSSVRRHQSPSANGVAG